MPPLLKFLATPLLRAYRLSKRIEIMEKLYSSKNMFENGWLGGASPLDLPMSALITMSLTSKPKSRIGFSMMRGKFCHSCFEMTARTALA